MDSTQCRVKKRVLSGGKIAFWQISWLGSSYNTDLLVQHTARHLNFTACKTEPIYSPGKKLGYWSLILWFKRTDYPCATPTADESRLSLSSPHGKREQLWCSIWEGMNAERPGGNQPILSKTQHYQCQKTDLAPEEEVCVCNNCKVPQN